MTARELLFSLLHTSAYAALGVVLLVLGFLLLDAVTPGDLRTAVFRTQARDAALVAATHMIATASVLVASIAASDNNFRTGFVSSAAHGLLGVVLLVASVVIVDLLTPGDLRGSLSDDDPHLHAGAIIVAATELAVGAIVAFSIL
jgi:uncharacterized membrane protein YjfL (UPF0719 family)